METIAAVFTLGFLFISVVGFLVAFVRDVATPAGRRPEKAEQTGAYND